MAQEDRRQLEGGPNGAAVGPDGAVSVCNNVGFEWGERPEGSIGLRGTPADYKGGAIQRVDLLSGAVTPLYTECDGRQLNGPNDLVFDAGGDFWFSDPGKSMADTLHHGQLFYARADGSMIRCVRTPMVTPNGVGLSPDQKTLFAAETLTSRRWAFELVGPGQFAEPVDPSATGVVLGPLPGYQLLDSRAVETGGKVCVGTLFNGGVTVFDPDGGSEHIAFPERMVTNIRFGGAEMRDA